MFAILILVFLAGLCSSLTITRPHTTLSTSSTTSLAPTPLQHPHTLTPRAPLPAFTLPTSPTPSSPAPAPPAPTPPAPTPPPTTITPNPHYTIPTEFLSQVPPLWPYTSYGVGVGKGETASWGITDGEGRSVAVVKARVLGYTKPGEGERDGLEGWRRTFVVPRATGG